MQLINGKEIADKILVNLKENIKNADVIPGLAIVLIGNNKASQIYVELKEKASQKIGINFQKFLFNKDVSEEDIIEKIEELNNNKSVHGIIVQLPLPEKFNTDKVINTISSKKDADGFRKDSSNENPVFPTAIMKMIQSVDREVRSAVIITKSERFGESMREILKKNNIESEYIFCKKINEKDLTKYEVVITACGILGLIKSNMVNDKVVIIDGGINKERDRVLGDVDINSFKNTNCYISPVPEGVGPVTVACLLESVYNLSLK